MYKMESLDTYQIAGAWVSIFITLAVFSFLYDDNPIYKFAEHLFMGVGIGYGVVEMYYNLLKPNLIDKLLQGQTAYFIPLVLSIMLLFKVSRTYAWVARTPIAILVAAYAAVKITGEASGKFIRQIGASFPDFSASWQKYGFWDWQADGAGLFSDAFLVLALSACLLHFYFSEIPTRTQKFGVPIATFIFTGVLALSFFKSPADSALGTVAIGTALGLCAAAPFLMMSPYRHVLTRFGVLVLMVSFGASFGFTVMGRISLAIGRGQELLGLNRAPYEVEQINPRLATIVSAVVIIGILVLWKKTKPQQSV
jgi:hypothetical protein